MIGLIVVLIVIVVGLYITLPSGVAGAPVVVAVKRCPLHDWVYGADEKLVCTVCGKKPGATE